ncbi:16S rRNA (cytosine(967)-C(5))-methyltransferase RsmB [Rubrivivax albus]|uniref:16S rRNA (cytosine(967)-C(5))-methyltransferase n=1 Tax=Rubrivivax albus TaxID=2499835 RepID=A0A3S2TRQ2_9BURK|nr:16S rRNA (cytosine(967)-C(5))-methyltransferase RsmB [Rubrivivax albus]RVT52374.1 16S rRNA (cytosine(967)-C(5))-methyltransferase RsmB [Rubrivivax albus]
MHATSPPLQRLLDLTADAVQAVQAGRSLNDQLARVPADARPGVQALSFHVLRWLGGAQAVRAICVPKTPPPNVDALLVSALALLWPTGDEPPYPDHTLVDQAVASARHRTPAAAGFINAVLRRFVRERAALVAQAMHQPEAAYGHPAWWIERIRQDWPAQWQPLLQQANRHPPMTLRVNARRLDAATYLDRLAAAGIAARSLADPGEPGYGGHTVMLARPSPVQALPGFAAGDVSVQDAAAQRAAPLLLSGTALPQGARVLDACAAPGGKTAHLLEMRPDLELQALDSDPHRLTRVQDTLARLHLAGPNVRLVADDAAETARWWDGRPFDAILLDAPCTASGIVRRHPDVRWLRRPDDVHNLVRIQARLLDALWPLLAPGGRLLYATCSVFKAEGSQQIDAFLQRHGAEEVTRDPTAPGHLLSLADNGAAPEDGFFYALLHKT